MTNNEVVFVSEKMFDTCGVCGKEIDVTSSRSAFNYHLATHYNPLGRDCRAWYKKYFKRDRGVCVCTICDEEFFHDKAEGMGAGVQYEQHLLQEHGIKREK